MTVDRLSRYATLIRQSPHNLLSKAALTELEVRHIPECVRFAGRLPASGRLLDIGSGGGLPGIVIAIARPDLQVHLVEATAKKARFLAETAEALGIPVTVHNARAEDLHVGPLRGTFDVITARAVAPLERLVPLAEPFLTTGGQLHAIKGDRWQDEVTDASSVIRSLGLRLLRTPADDPDLDPRVVVIGR